MKNIRAYKIIFPNGGIAFERKDKDGRGSVRHDSIKSLAEGVEDEVNEHLAAIADDGCVNENCKQVSIDLFPFHEIECSSGLLPRLCLALSPEEKQEFWLYYNQNS